MLMRGAPLAAVTMLVAAAAVPAVKSLPSPAATSAVEPPDWPAAVHFTGTTTTTISTATAGPALPAVVEHGSLAYWSSCSATEPNSGLLRQDMETLNPTTGAPLLNTSAVESCPDGKNYAQLTFIGSAPTCTATKLGGLLHHFQGWPRACSVCPDTLSVAKAVCTGWQVADDTVRGIKARRFTSTGCTVGRLGPTTRARQQTVMWYSSENLATVLRMQLTVNTVFGTTQTNNTVLTDVLSWKVAGIPPADFAHCTPATTAAAE